jgi:hypothetical protein
MAFSSPVAWRPGIMDTAHRIRIGRHRDDIKALLTTTSLVIQ